MKERPLLMSGPLVVKTLADLKNQTRRLVKGAALQLLIDGFTPEYVADPGNADLCPCGQPGDRLWVRETFQVEPSGRGFVRVLYAAGGEQSLEFEKSDPRTAHADRLWTDPDVFRPSIHMPRWASRLTLEITEVRVEHLQDISEEDAKAEGVEEIAAPRFGQGGVYQVRGTHEQHESARSAFAALWDSINGDRANWASNPWVWVVGFRRIRSALDGGE